uniref:Katanin p80 subunit C-terminal domain-containing protein n=1 Tax=Panagrolaimus sp. JU765 TaxID=591449 RepID=A0AC34R6I8_9BILA
MDGQDIRNFESVACDVQTMDAVFENGTLMHFGFSPNRNSLDLRTVTVEELLTPTTAVPELPVPTSLPLNSSPDFGRLGSPLSNFNSPEADSIASSDVSPMFTLAPPFPQSTVLEPDGFIESHQSTLDLLAKRKAEMTRIKSMMKNRNLEDDILDEASQLTDKSVLAHLLKTYPKPKTLKFAVRVLPEIRTMLSSTNSDFVEIGLTVLQDLASSLLPVIRQNIASDARSIGVDVVAEERQIMSIKCKEVLTEIYINSHFILERLNEEQQLKFNAAVEKFSDFV